MAEKSKVKSVTPNGTYEGNYGLMYKFDVEFENGHYGQAMGKSEQCRFVVGQEASYERTSREYNGQTYYNIKYVNESYQGGGGGGYKKDPATEKRIVRMNVLQRAVDMAMHDRIGIDEVIAYAEAMEKWVHGESVTLPKNLINANDLPFS